MAEIRRKNRTTKVWAHRGASGYRPENTMEAFELAIKQGADGIELDVHTSADGELIVMHDETVDRVTDKTGLIKDMTLAQVKELKVSTDAEPNGIYRVPTLAEVLDRSLSSLLSRLKHRKYLPESCKTFSLFPDAELRSVNNNTLPLTIQPYSFPSLSFLLISSLSFFLS